MTDQVTIWFNPACSKCREAKALIEARGVTPVVRNYLDKPANETELAELAALVGNAHALLRTREEEYRALQLSPQTPANEILAAIARFPTLLERPIVVRGQRAVVARPPEKLLTLFASAD